MTTSKYSSSICPKCESKLPVGALFCPNCGFSLEPVATRDVKANREDDQEDSWDDFAEETPREKYKTLSVVSDIFMVLAWMPLLMVLAAIGLALSPISEMMLGAGKWIVVIVYAIFGVIGAIGMAAFAQIINLMLDAEWNQRIQIELLNKLIKQ